MDQAVIHAEHQHAAQAVAPKWLHVDPVVAQLQAVAPIWLHADPAVAQLQGVDLAVAQKSLLVIHVDLHLVIADVAANSESVDCSLRFLSAKATAAVTHLQAATQVAIHAEPRAVAAQAVAVQLYRLRCLHQWLLQHQWLTHMLISTPSVMSFKQAAPEFVNSNFGSLSQDMI